MKPLIATLLVLAAAPALAQVAAPNPFSDRLARLGDLPRRVAMRNAILDSGQWCPRVIATARQQPWRNLVMWTARCDRDKDRTTRDYGVFVGVDGTVQVRPCGDLATLKLPTCRMPPARR